MYEIKQRKGFETRSYKIDTDSEFVEVDYKSIKDRLKHKIFLTEIGNEIQYESENFITNPHKIFSLFLGLLSLSSIITYFFIKQANPIVFILLGVLLGVLSFIGLIQPLKDDIIIVNGIKQIRLFRSKPNEEKVLEFVDFLIKISNTKKKELLIDFELTEEQFKSNLYWLLNMKLISKSEFDELKSEYNLKKLL